VETNANKNGLTWLAGKNFPLIEDSS